jgi:acetate kinase
MRNALLVLNAGSSSLKFSVFADADPPQLMLRGRFEGLLSHPHFTARTPRAALGEREWPAGTRLGHHGALEFLLTWSRSGVMAGHDIAAVGHRIVHGGPRFTGPALVDGDTVAALEALVPFAPTDQPHNLAAIAAVTHVAPELPQVASFDTAFHRTQPHVAQAFALPRRYAAAGIRRYGFHGLSCEYVASALTAIDRTAATGRTVIAHLGSSATMCAIRGGRSIATTMGFSTLDGLVMGTRCGAIDPGVVLYLIERHGMDAASLRQLLYERSGLLGVSGLCSDMRTLQALADPRAAEAVDLFVYRIGRELGSLAAALDGLDALVFTGGIGENATALRARVCDAARWLGLDLDSDANAKAGPRISRAGSRVSAWVIPSDEEAMIATHTRRVIGSAPRSRERGEACASR